MIRRNPERVAWLVIWGAFAVFLLLCAAVPLAVQYYLQHATSPQRAMLEVIGGTVRVRERGAAAPIAVTKSVQLSEGSAIETDENSRGILTFHDGSTTILFPSTQVTLREMHVSTFPWGVEPITIVIEQTRGRLRIGAAPLVLPENSDAPARLFQVLTPQIGAFLSEGSYAVEVSADASQVTVRDGTAIVSAQGRSVTLGRGQRTVSTRGEPPLPPLPAIQDLMVNGDFRDPLARGWSVIREPSGDSRSAVGTVDVAQFGERTAVRIARSGSNQTSAITGIVQQINREVSDYRTVRLSADIRVQSHSLSGGGVLSSEYPLILRLKYRDVYGSEAEWVHGFYVQNITGNPTNNGELVPANVWIPFEAGNLFELLDPKPFFITSLQIYASGWDYDAYVTGVRLTVE
jgi:hypothetical protein